MAVSSLSLLLQYLVGDRSDWCASLACDGGAPQQCERRASAAWAARRVVCGGLLPAFQLRLADESGGAVGLPPQRSLEPAWAQRHCVAGRALCFELSAPAEAEPQRACTTLLRSGAASPPFYLTPPPPLPLASPRLASPRPHPTPLPLREQQLELDGGALLRFLVAAPAAPSPSPPPLSPPPPPLSPPPPPLPPLSPPSPSSPPLRRVAALNARFARHPGFAAWRPTGELADAGVLLHAFDGWEDHARPWRAAGDQSAFLVYQANGFAGGTIPVFHQTGGGVIFRPGVTRLKCAKGGDSGGHCTRWCTAAGGVGDVASYQYPGDGCGGSWRPEDIGFFLQRQCAWQRFFRRLEYNEFIVDGDAWTSSLPDTIEAFFQIRDGGADAHRAFLKAFRLSEEEVPLVEMDIRNWDAPFRPL
ncbi:hypothetical protein AB1Y20_010920 [Prymnesium parvum]|uniref:Uncharacterized protein n=1 Tax=Prymnesium parvum TaxID=97485 RepID=A0AB34ITF5_PRYPA